ncbi:non-structural maintenance of chromosomes element 3 homolog isoform X2 [Bombina bombina]|nr:non-structural maintenance of chromosomes element 3 homolog isoform X2 [Bombina bombina]XP_053551500.1 non-structural maintenance of chromosomes element 3 homolog isoform X2 [Bombina bombina]XP_053551501.1 non-structural maintenance of chromosomes element 3 homolog isoform X2 [Bombina bombina]
MSQARKRGRPSTHRDATVIQGDDDDMGEDSSLMLTQSATQVQRNLEKHSPEQLSLKVGEVVQYFLIRDQKKLPIKRADIVKNVVKEYKDVYPEILNRAKNTLQQVFGFQLEEIDTKNHVYVLINKLERVQGDNIRVDDGVAKLGLLTVILSVIFMKGNTTKESVIWETLRRLRVDQGEKSEDFGDVKKLVTDEFVKQKYLEYMRIPHTDPVEHEFRWGPRAFKETSKMKILEFVSKIQKKDPKSWASQYKEAVEEASGAARTSGH